MRLTDNGIQSLRKTIKLGDFAVMGSDDVYLVYMDKKERTLNIETFKR